MNKQNLMTLGLALVALTGFAAAATTGLVIPTDQPICKLYGLIQLFATVGGVLVAAYSGFQLATSHDLNERNNSKMLLTGVVVGVIIVWIAPLLVQNLAGAGSVCGW